MRIQASSLYWGSEGSSNTGPALIWTNHAAAPLLCPCSNSRPPRSPKTGEEESREHVSLKMEKVTVGD